MQVPGYLQIHSSLQAEELKRPSLEQKEYPYYPMKGRLSVKKKERGGRTMNPQDSVFFIFPVASPIGKFYAIDNMYRKSGKHLQVI